MPNASSKAGHKAIRTCVICGKKAEQDILLGFYLLEKDIVFDIGRKVPTRKMYVCQQEGCLKQLDKWLARHLKKQRRNAAESPSGKADA
jgi:predicted RNA-binding protein YlxR (DUF448 family)